MSTTTDLKTEIKSLALKGGVDLVGIGSRERLAEAPTSADPSYILPSTQSHISIAIALDRRIIRDFLTKRSWLDHGKNRKAIYQKLYIITDSLVTFLRERGFEAEAVEANGIYRPEAGGNDAINRVEVVPDFSHRYGGVASGLGVLGWSGNLMTPQHGAAIYLATVLTSAPLDPDPLMEDNPCDRCLTCTTVCPVEMIDTKAEQSVKIGGREYRYGKKDHNARCIVGCGGYHGLEPNGEWSTWSPFRADYPLPEDRDELIDLSRQVRAADPDRQGDRRFLTLKQRCFDPEEVYRDTCGNCQIVCWARRELRQENQKLFLNSGVVALTERGERVKGEAGDTVEVESNRAVRVAVLKKEATNVNRWLEGALTKDLRK